MNQEHSIEECLPCPNCGAGEFKVNIIDGWGPELFAVTCLNCQRQGPCRLKHASAVSGWNQLAAWNQTAPRETNDKSTCSPSGNERPPDTKGERTMIEPAIHFRTKDENAFECVYCGAEVRRERYEMPDTAGFLTRAGEWMRMHKQACMGVGGQISENPYV